jgi:hypothetical protein
MYYSNCYCPREVEQAVAAKYDSVSSMSDYQHDRDCIDRASIRVAMYVRARDACPGSKDLSDALDEAWSWWCHVRAKGERCQCFTLG